MSASFLPAVHRTRLSFSPRPNSLPLSLPPVSLDLDFSSDGDYDPSSPAYPTTGSNLTSGRSSYEAFKLTRSRVIRLYNLPASSSATALALSRLFQLQHMNNPAVPSSPIRMWTLREDVGGKPPGEEDSAWLVYRSHEEACNALSLAAAPLSISTALESDLEPYSKLRKFEPRQSMLKSAPSPSFLASSLEALHLGQPPSPSSASGAGAPPKFIGTSSGRADAQVTAAVSTGSSCYQLSSNPPNPKPLFRLGDWICASPSCAAHNFGRNVVCIGCGYPRPSNSPTSPTMNHAATSSPAGRMSSPRFVVRSPYNNHTSPTTAGNTLNHPMHHHHPSAGGSAAHLVNSTGLHFTMPISLGSGAPPTAPASSGSLFNQHQHLAPLPHQPSFLPSPNNNAKPQISNHPLLTPSGRALAVGGKVQNVSRDPLAPCIMYWPDNEPLPEPGQIRPPGLMNNNVSHPPILNTGNRGPIEHQPGDWVCQKCDYLNWRRRKVCQTCFPYAEGNGDSVSAAVQAERIALLTSALAQVQQVQVQQQVARMSLGQGMHRPPHFPDMNISERTAIAGNGINNMPRGAGTTTPANSWPTPIAAPCNNKMNNIVHHPSTPSSNIVYQTPSSPIGTGMKRYEGMSHMDNLLSTGLLPSGLKSALDSSGVHTPSSLSPSSTSSADLSFDEYDDIVEGGSPRYGGGSVGSGRIPMSSNGSVMKTSSLVYPHSASQHPQHPHHKPHRPDSGSLSSSESGSTSSLTLVGSNIWAMDQNENKSWGSIALPHHDTLTGRRSRTLSTEIVGVGLGL